MSTVTLHITGLTPGESDTWTVTSVDATGVESAPSTGLVVHMLAGSTVGVVIGSSLGALVAFTGCTVTSSQSAPLSLGTPLKATASLTAGSVIGSRSSALQIGSLSALARLAALIPASVQIGNVSGLTTHALATLLGPVVSGVISGVIQVPSLLAVAVISPPTCNVVPVGAVSTTILMPLFLGKGTFSASSVTGIALSLSASLVLPSFLSNCVFLTAQVVGSSVTYGAIRAPTGEVATLLDIYGNPINLFLFSNGEWTKAA